jgi:hypothetical protein
MSENINNGCGQYILIGISQDDVFIWVGNKFEKIISIDNYQKNPYCLLNFAKKAKQFITFGDSLFHWRWSDEQIKSYCEEHHINRLSSIDLIGYQMEMKEDLEKSS